MARQPRPRALTVAAALAVALVGCSVVRTAQAGRQLADSDAAVPAPPPAIKGIRGTASNNRDIQRAASNYAGTVGSPPNWNGPAPPWVCSDGTVGCGYRYSPPPPPPNPIVVDYFPPPPPPPNPIIIDYFPPFSPSPPPPPPPPTDYYPPPPPPTQWPYPDFPYQGCYYQSTGTYKIKLSAVYPSSEETRYCFWIQAKHPDPYSYEQCRNFDLWSINFRAHIDCYDKVSYLTYNGQQLQPVWAPNLPPTKAMLQVMRGDGQVLDTQETIASHKAEVCFTLPNYCPLDKFCKGSQCRAAFYPTPYSGLNCCPGWWCKSRWWEGR